MGETATMLVEVALRGRGQTRGSGSTGGAYAAMRKASKKKKKEEEPQRSGESDAPSSRATAGKET